MKPMNIEKKQLNQSWHQPKTHLDWKIIKFKPVKTQLWFNEKQL